MMKIGGTYLQQREKRNILAYYILMPILEIFLEIFWKYLKYLRLVHIRE